MGKRSRNRHESLLATVSKFYRFIVAILLTSLLSGFSFAASTNAENLFDIYQLAKQNDPAFLASTARYNAAREAQPQAWAALHPQISARVSTTDNDQEVTSTSGSVTTGNFDITTETYSVSVTQAIYHHELFVAIRQADASVAKAEANFRAAEQDLLIRVATTYFNVLGALDNLEFAQAEKAAIEEQLQQTSQRFEVGLVAITDVHEAQARYDQSVAILIQTENELAISRERLREITGQEHNLLATLNDEHPLVSPEPNDISVWVTIGFDNNLSLLAAQKDKEIAMDEVNRIQAGHYPTVDLVAQYSNTDVSGNIATYREVDETSLTLQLNLPLYQGGQVNSQTREAEYAYEESRAIYTQQRRATERQVRNSYLSVIANISRVQALEQALASSEIALEATKAGYEVGTRTAVDVLNSQREYFRAKRDYARSRYDYILETLKLKQAAGILHDDSISQVNNWLQ